MGTATDSDRDDERELRPIDPDGYVRIEEEGDQDRRLEITIGPDGNPSYEYEVDRDDRPFDDEAQEWLAKITTKLIRSSGSSLPSMV